MRFFELFAVAAGVGMDAFVAAACVGLSAPKPILKRALTTGLCFGAFHIGMPLAGYLLAWRFADAIAAGGPWIAFALFGIIGGKIIFESLKQKNRPAAGTGQASLKPVKLLSMAAATSIDALAVGISYAFLKVHIVPAVLLTGCVALALSTAGVIIGNVFGARFKSRAELAGGVVLLLMGLKVLLERLGILTF